LMETREEMPETELAQAEKWLKEDRLARLLLEKSRLNPKVFKTMLLYYWGGGVPFEELAKKMHVQKPGAWKRWQRGRDAVLRSFYTLELAMYAGVLEPDIADIVSQDLQDYASLAREEGGLEEIQNRIEERLVKMKKLMQGGRATP